MSKTGGQAEVRLHLAVRYNAMLVAGQTKSSISHSIFSDHARTPSSQLILGASTHTTWLLTWGSRHSHRFNRCGLMLIRTSLRYLARAYVSQSGLSHTGRLEIEGLGLEDKVGLQLMLRLRDFLGINLTCQTFLVIGQVAQPGLASGSILACTEGHTTMQTIAPTAVVPHAPTCRTTKEKRTERCTERPNTRVEP